MSAETPQDIDAAISGFVDQLLAHFRPTLIEAFTLLTDQLVPPAPPDEDIGPALRRIRQKRGLTLAQIAARTGFSISHLSQIERGKTTPTVNTINQIVACYGMEISVRVHTKDAATVAMQGAQS